MNKKAIVIGIVFLLVLGLFFVFKGGILGKVISSSSDIPSGICKDCNVVLISIDTLRADHLPCYGYNKNTAPNICALAKDSIFFKNAYSVSAWTYPSHYSMLTGLYPSSHNIIYQREIMPFSENTPTLQKSLKEKAYSTAGFTNGGYVGKFLGFNESFGTYISSVDKRGRFEDNKEEVKNWLSEYEKKENPFFLFLHGYDVHTVYSDHSYDKLPLEFRFKFFENGSVSDKCYNAIQTPGSDITACKNNADLKGYIISQYDGSIYGADEYIKTVIDELKEKGIYNKTIIIITADHGERFGEKRKWWHTDTLAQELIKVPFIMYIPGVEGKEIETPVSNLDITPTVLDLLGIENNSNLDGQSLLPIVNGGKGRPVYSLTEALIGRDENSTIWYSMIEDNLKFVFSKRMNFVFKEVYDLNSDPHEQINLAGNEKYAEMDKNLLEWINKIDMDGIKPDMFNDEVSLEDNLELIGQLKSLGYLN